MKTMELFCGTKSFSKYAESLGHETFTIDNEKRFNPDLIFDLRKELTKEIWDKIDESDIIWMSPPCKTLSMASGNTHWTATRMPKTQDGKDAFKMIKLCRDIGDYCDKHNKIYFIENPRARARWFLYDWNRKTAWYCQYGDKRAKPTDIWTNLEEWQPKQCFNGNRKCHHEPAPRGLKTGTQGIKTSEERAKIPKLLFKEIFKVIKNGKRK